MLVVLEWADLDPRLGLRRFAAAVSTVAADVLRTSSERLDLLAAAIGRQADHTPVVLALPSLPVAPVFLLPGWQSGAAEISLRRRVLEFAERCLASKGVKLANMSGLKDVSSSQARRFANGELGADLPYQTPHVAALAELLVRAALPRQPLKGLITDLDDTLWKGLVGEVGAAQVAWSLDDQAQIHGVYQHVLRGLAAKGVLIAITSKNTAEVVQAALTRSDILLPRDQVYPIEVGWGPKSEAVERILKRWNISADSVAFVDDSLVELAEVQTRFPDITALQFPADDNDAALEMIDRLLDLFGRDAVNEDDSIRASSLRQSDAIPKMAALDFIRGLNGRLTFDFSPDPNDARPLELLNKTNQFNINGVRLEASDWKRALREPGQFAATVKYADRLGPVGVVSVVLGRVSDGAANLTSWVLSCRAFSRHIEHVVLEFLAECLGVSRFVIEFVATERNAPLRKFLSELGSELPSKAGKVTIAAPVPTHLHQRVIRER